MRPTGNETGDRMNATAIDLRERDVADPTLSARLMSYWRTLGARSVVARRRDLDGTRVAVRAGAIDPEALVPFALGDIDHSIVLRATHAYLDSAGGRRAAAVDEAIEWIRRRLALNRAAVFVALLSLGDAEVLGRLRALRLALDDDEFDAVRRGADELPPCGAEFVQQWQALRGPDYPADGNAASTAG